MKSYFQQTEKPLQQRCLSKILWFMWNRFNLSEITFHRMMQHIFRQKSLQFSHSSPFTHFVTLVNRRLSKETYLRVLWKKIISADHLSNCGAFYDSTSSGHVWNHFLFCDAADFPDEKVVFIITDRSDEKVLLQLFRSSFHAFSSRCTWICTQSCKEYWWSWCSNALLPLQWWDSFKMYWA